MEELSFSSVLGERQYSYRSMLFRSQRKDRVALPLHNAPLPPKTTEKSGHPSGEDRSLCPRKSNCMIKLNTIKKDTFTFGKHK